MSKTISKNLRVALAAFSLGLLFYFVLWKVVLICIPVQHQWTVVMVQ